MEFGQAALASLARLRSGVRSRRWSSYDVKGGNADNWPIGVGQTVILGETQSPGCIRHIWMTTSEADHNLRRLVLRIYWDGEECPAVVCPLGDFFGLGHGKATYFQSLPLQAFYLGMNCWFPMPFANGAKITVTNDSDADSFLYFYIDYHELDLCPPDTGRFCANWRRELLLRAEEPTGLDAWDREARINTTARNNYLILDARGRGHYVGCCLHIDTDEPGWWGEGDDMFFVDGESWPPGIHGTGTEDYFCGAWNYNRLARVFCTPYFGYHFKGNADYTGKHSQYRFHIEDPICFNESLAFSIEHGHANDRQGDWTSTAYWYQLGRRQPLPEIAPFADRIPFAFGGMEAGGGRDRKDLPT
jgi:hypothetical protein